jgi:hypothetical protein
MPIELQQIASTVAGLSHPLAAHQCVQCEYEMCRDWRRDRRHRSRSPLARGSSRRERSRSHERDRFGDRYDNDSSFHHEREDYSNQEYEDNSMSSMPTSIEYHHGLPEQKTPLLVC